MTTVIKQQDFIDSVYEGLQYISYYHPMDFLEALKKAYEREQNQPAKDAIAQILVNSKMCAMGHRPLCQDTGIVTAFVEIGMDVRFDGDMTVQEMVDEGTRRAYCDPDNPLRKSVLRDPAGDRVNTKDNTPAVVHISMVKGDKVTVKLASKGGGSENKSKLVMLNPSDSIVDWVLEQIPHMGAGWCPPGVIGLGIGGTMEKAAVMAKEALMDPVDIDELIKRGPKNADEKLRLELYDKINRLGIGAQGLGGLTTVVDVKIKSYPTHATSKPVALIPNCAASRHIDFTLDGSGPVKLVPPFRTGLTSTSATARAQEGCSSTTSPGRKSIPGRSARLSCSTARSSPDATLPTSASLISLLPASLCLTASTSTASSSTTSDLFLQSGMRL